LEDGKGGEEEDDEMKGVFGGEEEDDEGIKRLAEEDASKIDVGDGEGHGRLVREILREEKGKDEGEMEGGEGEEKEESGGIRFGRVKGTKMSSKGISSSSAMTLHPDDLVRLREAVQSIVKASSPLSKCFDFVSEDLGFSPNPLTYNCILLHLQM